MSNLDSPIAVPDELMAICGRVKDFGGRALLVGGCVRDHLLGGSPKDWDLEIFGLEPDRLESLAGEFGKVNTVGKSFGVTKLNTGSGEEYDLALPRRERKIGDGHRGFEVEVDPNMSLEEAAKRRDFTINAISYDPLTRETIDPLGGQTDLRDKILRPTSDRFKEDPLRVLRGMQFAGRFDMDTSVELILMAQDVDHTFVELPKERVYGEFSKWASKSLVPSKGIQLLEDTKWIKHFPEIHALAGCEQSPKWHPEGDVLTHTKHCCDALAAEPDFRAMPAEKRTSMMLAMLGHDFGKPSTTRKTELVDGTTKITAYGHEAAGVPPFKQFLSRMGAPNRDAEMGAPLVKEHLIHANFQGNNPPKDATIAKIADRIDPASVSDLCLIMQADLNGRPPLPKEPGPGVEALRMRSKELGCYDGPVTALIGGKDLLGAGERPGTGMGSKLKNYLNRQIEGEFRTREEALEVLASDYQLKPTEGFTIGSIFDEDGEVDFEAAEALGKIAKEQDLGITRGREPHLIARNSNGKVVGGAFIETSQDKFTFDVVVAGSAKGLKLGSRLLDDVLEEAANHKAEFPDAAVSVDVVNDRMRGMLERRGFSATQEVSEDRWIMQPEPKPTPAEELPADLDREVPESENSEFSI